MGAGIAIVAARAGFRAIVFDARSDAIDKARKQTLAFFAKSVEKGKLAQAQVDGIMANWIGTSSIDDLAQCDLVIEGVFEDLKVKHQLFAALNKVCPAETIFA